MAEALRKVRVERWRGEEARREPDVLAVEEPLGVWLDGTPYATLMRTPGDDEALVYGFLFAEGVIGEAGDVAEAAASGHPQAQEYHVRLRRAGPLAGGVRSTMVSSSCGVCGRASIRELEERMEPIAGERVDPRRLSEWLAAFVAGQKWFPATGGVHAAGLFRRDGEMVDVAEDVGRHNALDKVVGRALLGGRLPLREHVLLMSSRASFDIVQKAALAGISTVATMGAASSLAAETALAVGVQLCVFLREGGVVEIGSVG